MPENSDKWQKNTIYTIYSINVRWDKKEKKKGYRITLQPLRVFRKGQPIGTAFLSCIKRANRNVYLIVQVKDKYDRKKVLDCYMILIPLQGQKAFMNLIESIKPVIIKNRGKAKWEITQNEIVYKTKTDRELLDYKKSNPFRQERSRKFDF